MMRCRGGSRCVGTQTPAQRIAGDRRTGGPKVRSGPAHDALGVVPVRRSPNGTRPLSATTERVDGRVVRMVRANPRATWRVVKDRTGLSEANAKRALTAARRKLRVAAEEAQVQQALEPSPANPNGRGG